MKTNFVNIINHSILIDEIGLDLLKNKQSFIAYGILSETNSLMIKQENKIPEIFTQYTIKFDESIKETVICNDNYYCINLKKINILKKQLPLKCLNTYKVEKNNVNFIHMINFVFKDELIESFYFSFNSLTKQKKISNLQH